MKPLGIRSRVLLAALLPVALLSAVLATVFLVDRVNDLDTALRQRAKALMRQVVSGSEYGLFSGNREALQNVIDRVKLEDEVRSVTLIATEGNIFIRAGNAGYDELPGPSENSSEVFDPAAHTLLLAQPIYGSQLVLNDLFTDVSPPKPLQLGRVVLELSTDGVLARKRELLLAGILTALGSLLFGSLLAVRLSRGVIKPIVQIGDVVERIAHGDLAARVAIGGNSSLHRLKEGLNQMAARIESGQEELQRQIAEATAELRVKKEEAELATQAISQANNELVSIMEANPDILYVINIKGELSKWNSNFAKFCGLPHSGMMHRQVTEFVCMEDRATVMKGVMDIFERGVTSIEVRFVRHDGALVPYLCNGVVLKDAGGKIIGATGTGRDITERKAAEESLQLASLVYQNSSEAMAVTDADGSIITINAAFTKVTGYTLDEVIGSNPSILNSGLQDQAFYRTMWHEINTTGHWQGEIWDRRKNGEVYAKWLAINSTFNEDGSVHRRVALFSDITKKKESEELIWNQANFDELTGLPNRRMFYDRLDQEIKKAHRASLPLALMFLDLDGFKDVNDTLGHDIGDILLKDTALRLSSCVRESDTVARLGGDEFTVVLGELDDPDSVERVAQEILRKLAEPFQLGIETAYISASIGITLYPDDATGIDELIKNADQAMYAAKSQGRNRCSYFTASMQEAAQTRMRLAGDLRCALAGNQFRLYYQPVVELATGAIHKAEALIRWQHPTRGLVGPSEFIPIAEDTGMIMDIGDWVFLEAARQAKHWRASHDPAFQISVNMSPVQFNGDGNSQAAWFDQLRILGLPGQGIGVEITEGLLLDARAAVTDKLLEFRDAGIQVSLDDFGTGYSSLSYLNKFDIDYLKIDRSFVHNLAPDSSDLALCEAIIVMAHKLDLQVIAEGVETAAQRDLLAASGCDFAQGHLYSVALPAEDFEALLAGDWRLHEGGT